MVMMIKNMLVKNKRSKRNLSESKEKLSFTSAIIWYKDNK